MRRLVPIVFIPNDRRSSHCPVILPYDPRIYFQTRMGPVVVGSCGSWIYNYLYNQCLSPFSCEFESHSWWGILDTTLCDKVCWWLVTGQWFSSGTPVSSTNKNDIMGIFKVMLNIITLTQTPVILYLRVYIYCWFFSVGI